jgi:hypothetical protein
VPINTATEEVRVSINPGHSSLRGLTVSSFVITPAPERNHLTHRPGRGFAHAVLL